MYTPFLANTTKYPFGIEIDKSEGIFIYDKNGKKYFDLIAGIAVSNFGTYALKPQDIQKLL